MPTPYASFTGRFWLTLNIWFCTWQVARAKRQWIRYGTVGWWDDWRYWKDIHSWWSDRLTEFMKVHALVEAEKTAEKASTV